LSARRASKNRDQAADFCQRIIASVSVCDSVAKAYSELSVGARDAERQLLLRRAYCSGRDLLRVGGHFTVERLFLGRRLGEDVSQGVGVVAPHGRGIDSSMSAAVSLAACAERCARLRTSSATTTGPLSMGRTRSVWGVSDTHKGARRVPGRNHGDSFPDLKRSHVYECLAYYEDHRADIDDLVADQMHDPNA
jgi:hypothetical protein